jgi:antirestriction protein ArdC
MQKDKNVLKAGVILPDGQITQKSVQPFVQKFSAFAVGQISGLSSRVSRQ